MMSTDKTGERMMKSGILAIGAFGLMLAGAAAAQTQSVAASLGLFVYPSG